MAIKNYTSEVAAEKSLAKIEKLLVSAGARKIMKDYSPNEQPCSITFQLPIKGKMVSYRLTAKLEELYNHFTSQYVRPTTKSLQNSLDQAERTAWKIISDWVEIQLTMIELNQGKTDELFLPFMHNGHSSFYEVLIENGNITKFIGDGK